MGTFSTQYSVIIFTDMKPRLVYDIMYIQNGYIISKVLKPMATLTLQHGHLNTRVWGYRREYFLTGLLNFAVNYIIIHNF
jgi:hypothetical protein